MKDTHVEGKNGRQTDSGKISKLGIKNIISNVGTSIIDRFQKEGITLSQNNPLAIYNPSTKKLSLFLNGKKIATLDATHGSGKLGDDTPGQHGTPKGIFRIGAGESQLGSSPRTPLGGGGAIAGADLELYSTNGGNAKNRGIQLHGLMENYAYTEGCVGVMPQDVPQLMNWTKAIKSSGDTPYLYIS